MQFEIEQPIAAPRDAVIGAVVDPSFYGSMVMQKLAPPSVLDCTENGDVTSLRVRYRFVGNLSRAARAVLDPDKMTWVIELDVDRKLFQATFLMIPDNYQDRIKCSGSYQFSESGAATNQTMHGEIVVHAPLVAGLVERVIVSGFRDNLNEQAEAIERFVKGSPDQRTGRG